MGGHGATGKQVDTAIGNQAGLASTAGSNANQLYGQSQATGNTATAGYQNLAQNGLPFYRNLTDYNSGTIAQAFAPQRAAILRSTNQYANMPSGYRQALLTSLGAQQGTAFDNSLTQAMMANQQAKMQGLAGLQGEQQIAANQALGYGSLAGQANQSVIGAPRKPGVLGVIGGAANNVLQDVMQRPSMG